MTEQQIGKLLRYALMTRNPKEKRLVLTALAREDAENPDVRVAQTELGMMHYSGNGAPFNLERAEELLKNPAEHGDSRSLLMMGAIRYQKRKSDALHWFCRAWISGGSGAEGAAARLESLRLAGLGNPAFMDIFNEVIHSYLAKLEQMIQDGKDEDGSLQIAMALYYIYELDGHSSGNLERAYACLKLAEAKDNALYRIYLNRTAFSHMENPKASARMEHRNLDYEIKPKISRQTASQNMASQGTASQDTENFLYEEENTGSFWGGESGSYEEPETNASMLARLPGWLYSGSSSYVRRSSFGWGVEYENYADPNDRITISTVYNISGGGADTNAGYFYF